MHSSASKSLSPSTSSNAAPPRSLFTIFGRAENVHRKLLYELMSTVYEYLVVTVEPVTVANAAAAAAVVVDQQTFHSNESLFIRIHRCVEQIFLNGLRMFKPDNSPDCWRFIEALNWLNPNMTKSIANQTFFSDHSPSVQLPKITRIRNDNALAWIYENLRSNQLVARLRCLLSDSEHLINCYEVTIAFFHSKKFVDAMFECLIALEKQQPQLLAQIDRNLYTIAAIAVGNEVSGWQISEEVVTKQPKLIKNPNCDRSGHISSRKSKDSTVALDRTCNKRTVSSSNLNKIIAKRLKRHSYRIRCKCKHVISVKLRPWVSLPDIRNHNVRSTFHYGDLNRWKSQPTCAKSARIKLTAETLAINEKRTQSSASPLQRDACQTTTIGVTRQTGSDADPLRPINLVKCDDIKIHLDRRHLTHERSNDFPAEFTSPANDCLFNTKSSNNLTTLFRILPNKKNIFPFLSNTNSSNTSNESGSGLPGRPTGDFVSFGTCNGEKIENRYRRSVFNELLTDSPPLPSTASLSPFHKKRVSKSTVASKTEPTRGQTLTSYLQETQRSRINVTDLERENAHFSLSDAIISVIEEIKCGRHERQKEKQIRAAAIARRKNRVRPRRLKNWVSMCDNKDHLSADADAMNLSECASNISESNLSIASSTSSSSTSSSDSNSSHVSSNSDTSTASKPGDLKYLKIFSVSSHSINDHAAYAEWAEHSIESMSAEGIALSLISKFKDRQLPRAADLLTHTYDHQTMNRIYDVAPEDFYQTPYTRGTSDWAPPRAQIIFTRHLPPDRKKVIQKQNNRCAGCGMHVAAALQYSLRYCEYLGKYHCTGCHRNQISAIPARVLDRWDFSCHPVSVFSYRLLDQIWKVPLFRVPDLSKELYSKVRALRLAHLRRTQLKYVHDFIDTCRFADDLKREFECIPVYIYDDPDNWSMNDFIDVRNGAFLKAISEIILRGEQHVYACELCMAHGFLCEYCTDKQVIFPWQSRVIRCKKCGSCSHNDCWKNKCSKCQRLEKLKKN